MSDITPPSFIDDGVSFTRRIPPPTSHANVSQWLNSTGSDTASAYTGSYIDDGADMLLPRGPGFGKIDARFYRQKKRKEGEAQGAWNENIARAVDGDMQRSLARMRGVANVEVKRPEKGGEEENNAKGKRGVVSVPAPLKWGTFVIKGDDGRVIVVDENGEFDSRPVREGEMGEEKTQKEKRWVKAASSIDTPASPHQPAHQDDSTPRSNKEKSSKPKPASKSRSRSKTHLSHLRTPTKPLPSIPESSSSSSHSDDAVKTPSIASPTAFFMTGGLSGWPSHAPSPTPPPPTIPHAITWRTSPSPNPLRSPVQSLPGGWPAPPISSTRSSSSFTDIEDSAQRDGSTTSRRRKERQEYERVSVKSDSMYRVPALVEVIYDETPPGEVSYSQAGWGEKAPSSRGWGAGHKNSEAGGWAVTVNSESVESISRVSAVSNLGWGGSKDGSKTGRSQGWDGDEDSNNNVNDTGSWDGFERPKTASEVSVVGSRSERSWADKHSRAASSHSHRSHGSNKSHRSRYSQMGWGGSQAGGKVNSAIQGNDDDSWTDSPTKYHNGFNEGNETYLNETWG